MRSGLLNGISNR